MGDLAEDPLRPFLGGAVERRSSMSRAEFLEEYERRKPVVLAGGARTSAPVQRWDPEYLVARAGHARLALLAGVYEPGANTVGFPAAREVDTTLGEVVAALLAGDPSKGYVFNCESGVLRSNESSPELQMGWGDHPNPGLAALGDELEPPSFLRKEDLIHAFLVLGGPEHAAPLHYDLGGEAKALVQIRGRKRMLFFPPAQVPFLGFPGWFEESPTPYSSPHASRVDLRRPDFARFPDLARARALEARLEPGDIVYWPPFWAHDVTNLDPFTLAVSCSFEELGASCMSMREQLGLFGRLFLHVAESESPASSRVLREEFGRIFRRMESVIQSDPLRERSTMAGWNAAIWRL